MTGISCETCGAQLKVIITGGSFLVKEYSTLDDINFETAPDNKIITRDNPNPETETPLTVDVVCSKDSNHDLFGTTVSKVKVNIYLRIIFSAQKYMQKYR
jgi:hypothetical protein